MSTMKKCLAVASYLLLLPLQSGATYFANNGTMTCTYPVTVTVNEMTCADTEYCSFGDEMSVYGSLTLEENLPSYEMCVTTKICFMGYSWLCKRNVNVTTNVCNSLGVSDSLDGTPCPNAGTFDFGSTVQVPGRPSVNLGSGEFRLFCPWDIVHQHSRLKPLTFPFFLFFVKAGGSTLESMWQTAINLTITASIAIQSSLLLMLTLLTAAALWSPVAPFWELPLWRFTPRGSDELPLSTSLKRSSSSPEKVLILASK